MATIFTLPPPASAAKSVSKCIAGDHTKTPGIMIGDFLQGSQTTLVALNGDNIGPLSQQGAREAAWARANFDNSLSLQIACLPRDLGQSG